MKVFTALLGELKGVFGKAYVFSGVLPAALVVLGWTWYRSGKSLKAVVVETAAGFDGQATAELMASALLVLLLGLAFFAARSLLASFLQNLPGRTLRPLRRLLIRRQVGRWLAAERESGVRDHLLTVVTWATERDFARAKYLPPGEPVPGSEEMQAASCAGATALRGARRSLHRQPPTRQQGEAVVAGLRLLYAYAVHHCGTKECSIETQRWREHLQSPGADKAVSLLVAEAQRTWTEARLRLDSFPDPQWIRPTALGTRASALDDYAEKRYGIDTSTLLTRLWGVLTKEEQAALGDSRLSIEVLVNLVAAMALLALAVAGRVVASIGAYGLSRCTGPWCWTPAELVPSGRLAFDPPTFGFLVGTAVLAILFYNAAVFSYSALAERIIRVVDLRRLKLVKELGFKAPRDVGEERELWAELARFFTDAEELDRHRPIQPPGGS